MRTSAFFSYSLFLFCATSSFLCSANSVLVHVVDQQGQPISQVVVEPIFSRAADNEALISPTTDIAIMDQVNKAFVPHLLVVTQGQRVSFPNSDDIRHHVYSFSPAKQFELKLYAGKPKAPVRFENSGVAVLGCNIHDSMVGYIYVAASPVYGVTDAKGQARLKLSRTPDALWIWHERLPDPQKRQRVDFLPAEGAIEVSLELAAPTPRNTFRQKFGQ